MQGVGTHAQEMEGAIHLQCSARMLRHQSSPRQDGRIEHDVDRVARLMVNLLLRGHHPALWEASLERADHLAHTSSPLACWPRPTNHLLQVGFCDRAYLIVHL